jgi:HEAT repeat protein
LTEALDGVHPDMRRQAIERVAASSYSSDDTTLRTLDVILRTDSSALVRRAAARTLGGAMEVTAMQSLEALLDPDADPQRIRPPGPALFTDVLAGLSRLRADGVASTDDAQLLRHTVRLFNNHPTREVRIAAAELMGSFQDGIAVQALMASMGRDEFTVAYEARRALTRLSGQDHGSDVTAWQAWWSANPGSFAHSAPISE